MSTQPKPTGEISDFDGGPMPAKGESCTCSHATCACPVHWPLVRIDQPGEWTASYLRQHYGLDASERTVKLAVDINASLAAKATELHDEWWERVQDANKQLDAERESFTAALELANTKWIDCQQQLSADKANGSHGQLAQRIAVLEIERDQQERFKWEANKRADQAEKQLAAEREKNLAVSVEKAYRNQSVRPSHGELPLEARNAITERDELAISVTEWQTRAQEAEKQLANERENEGTMLRKLSDALTGGNAGTWEEILRALEKYPLPDGRTH